MPADRYAALATIRIPPLALTTFAPPAMAACPILGFAVQMEPAPGVDVDALWRAFNAWLGERGLQCVEGDEPPPALSYLVSSEAGQATDLDRDAMVVWLGARADVSDYGVGPLVDLERTAEA